MTNPRASTSVTCQVCGKTISRKADIGRHMKTHALNKEELMHHCPYSGCSYKTLQRSNLRTHLNVHAGYRPNVCPEEGCKFRSSDPGSLTRHRKEQHGYEPRGRSSTQPSASVRRTTRQRRRNTPYTTFTSPETLADSVSPRTPPLLLLNDRVEEHSKNTSVAYSTELITRHAWGDDSYVMPNPCLEGTSLRPDLSTASEVSAAECSQLPVSEQGLYVANAAFQQVGEMSASDEVFNNFLAQFDDWKPDAASVYTTPSLPSFIAPYSVDHASLHNPMTAPQHTADNPHGYYDMSFDTQFPQLDSFGIPDMGVHPAAVYPQDVDQWSFYDTYPITSGFATQDHRLN